MVVADAGVWIKALIDEERGQPLRRRLADEAVVDAPAVIDLEFLSAVRGLLVGKRVTRDRVEQAIDRFLAAPIERHAHGPLAWRIWELRNNLTAYDAAYVALAERLGLTLLTIDRRLARAPTIRCRVEPVA